MLGVMSTADGQQVDAEEAEPPPELSSSVRDGVAVVFAHYNTPTGFPSTGNTLTVTVVLKDGQRTPESPNPDTISLRVDSDTTISHLIRKASEMSGRQLLPTGGSCLCTPTQ